MIGKYASLSIDMTLDGNQVRARIKSSGVGADLISAWIRAGQSLAKDMQVPFFALAYAAQKRADKQPNDGESVTVDKNNIRGIYGKDKG